MDMTFAMRGETGEPGSPDPEWRAFRHDGETHERVWTGTAGGNTCRI